MFEYSVLEVWVGIVVVILSCGLMLDLARFFGLLPASS